jgi:hypothetical protein
VYAMLDALVSRLGDVSSVEETPAD